MEKNPAEEDGGVAKGSDTKKKEDSIQEKKRPSEKKIYRKQKPQEVPDFLVIDSSIIPQERDLRYLDKGSTTSPRNSGRRTTCSSSFN